MRCGVNLNTLACQITTACECFSCGNPACCADSRVAVKYYRWSRKRICNDCIEDRRSDIEHGMIRFLTPRR